MAYLYDDAITDTMLTNFRSSLTAEQQALWDSWGTLGDPNDTISKRKSAYLAYQIDQGKSAVSSP